jgi:porin
MILKARQRSTIRTALLAVGARALTTLTTQAFASETPPAPQAANQGDEATDPQTSPPPQTPAHAPATKPRRMECPHPTNPHRRHVGCKDEPFDWDEVLVRDSNGLRSTFRDLGVSVAGSYTGALQTNVTGGPHQIWGYAGQLVLGLNVDLSKLIKARGLSVYFGGSWGTGDNISGPLQTLFPVNSIYASSYYLGEMYLQQTLFEDKLTLAAGRLSASNTFAMLPVFLNYVNYGINPNPYPLGGNDITFFGPPTGTEWGAQAIYNVTPWLQASAGLYNNNLNSAAGQNHGTDWTLQQGNKGALVAAQVTWFPHKFAVNQGRLGMYSVGVITDNNSFSTLPDGRTTSGGYAGVFVQGQEMVYQPDGRGTEHGLTVWGSFAYNSKPLISVVPVFGGAGASYQVLIRRRKNDSASVGWIYGGVSQFVPNTTAEQVLELNYRFVFRKFLAVTPDFQYIWHPGGYNKPGIAVPGVQALVTF